jgi:hypothetical protein
MNEVRNIIIVEKIWRLWMELIEIDLSRFRWLQGGLKSHSFRKCEEEYDEDLLISH